MVPELAVISPAVDQSNNSGRRGEIQGTRHSHLSEGVRKPRCIERSTYIKSRVDSKGRVGRPPIYQSQNLGNRTLDGTSVLPDITSGWPFRLVDTRKDI